MNKNKTYKTGLAVKVFLSCWLSAMLPLLASCIDYSDATEEISAQVQLVLPSDFTGTTDLSGHEVVMSNNDGTIVMQATTDSQGVATFSSIIPDVYNISCSWEITAEEYHALTGDAQVISGATVSGSLNSQLLKEVQTVQLSTLLSINRDIVIGKVYFAGAKDINNKNYLWGSYVELYNQSDNDVDVSGLYLGLLDAGSTMAYTLENLHEQHADSVVLLKQIFRIPANAGKTMSPGGTVLLVNSAIDHSLYSNMEYSLLDADFEAKDANMTYTNNPATPALEPVYLQSNTTISNMNLVRGGPCGVVIFRTNDDVTQWPRTYKYPNTDTKGAQWVLLPKRFIIDGVDILKWKATGIDVQTKRLYDEIDAGYTSLTNANGLTGEVVYRKTSSKRGADGHKILEDTNNSSNDFTVSTTIKPREYDE